MTKLFISFTLAPVKRKPLLNFLHRHHQLNWFNQPDPDHKIKMAIYCPQGGGTLRQQLSIMHGIAWFCMVLHHLALCCTMLHHVAPEYARVCHSMPEYAKVVHKLSPCHPQVVSKQGGITCGAIDEPRKSSKAIDERVIINFRDKNVIIACFRDKNVYW